MQAQCSPTASGSDDGAASPAYNGAFVEYFVGNLVELHIYNNDGQINLCILKKLLQAIRYKFGLNNFLTRNHDLCRLQGCCPSLGVRQVQVHRASANVPSTH